jgi:hypothetical protein
MVSPRLKIIFLERKDDRRYWAGDGEALGEGSPTFLPPFVEAGRSVCPEGDRTDGRPD